MISRMTRVVAGLVGGSALIALSACSPAGSGDEVSPTPPKPDALAGVDPCGVIKAEDITHLGLKPQGEPDSLVPEQPGCKYSGGGKIITLSRESNTSVDAYSKKPFDKFERVSIAGRPGASFVSPGAQGTGYCSAVLDAGSGVVILDATAKSNVTGFDACGETLKLAEKIAPRLPKPE